MPALRAPVGVARGWQAGSARSVAAVRGMCGVKEAVLQKKELLALSMRSFQVFFTPNSAMEKRYQLSK